MEAKYGIKESYLMMLLLCKIYKDGYYLQWGEEQNMIFAHKLGREFAQEEVSDMISILLEKEKNKPLWQLLAKTKWEKIEAPGRYILKVLPARGGFHADS